MKKNHLLGYEKKVKMRRREGRKTSYTGTQNQTAINTV